MSNFRDVGDFHEKFGLDFVESSSPCGYTGPTPWDAELLEFRKKFLQEELAEFIEGMDEYDHAKMFDALLDIVYVAMGTAHLLGYPWEEGWRRVQKANMAKVRAAADGSDSKRSSSFDVVKPEGWQAPDIEGLLRDWGWCP